MNLIKLSKGVSAFVDITTQQGILSFNLEIAHRIAMRHGIQEMDTVWEELKESGIIVKNPIFSDLWSYDLAKLEFFFNRERWN